jgi:hypothetical protein
MHFAIRRTSAHVPTYNVTDARLELADCYIHKNRCEEALVLLYGPVKDGIEHVFGTNHLKVTDLQTLLEVCYARSNNRKLARESFQSALDLAVQLKGDDHPDTVNIRTSF